MRKFPVDYEEKLVALLTQFEDECAAPEFDDPTDARTKAERLNSLAMVASGLLEFKGKHVEQAKDLRDRLMSAVFQLEALAAELEGPEPDYYYEHEFSTSFDIDALFSDL